MFIEDNIENIIINKLQFGPIKTIDLIEYIKNKRKNTTKQAVYLIFKKLKSQEIIVISNKVVSLNSLWLEKLSRFLNHSYKSYITKNSVNNYFINLKDGEKINYYFKSTEQLDAFWAHVIIMLLEITQKNDFNYVYVPHYWFSIARSETEDEYYKIFPKNKKFAFILVGNNTPLDKEFTKNPFNKNTQSYALEKPLFNKNNYYLNIIGDYIVEVYLNKTISDKIDEYYNNTKDSNNINKDELIKIIQHQEKSRFSISKNYKKASRLKKKMSKYFYIPK